MRVAVVGLWHLGCVVAASLAEHFQVVGYDPDRICVAELRKGKAPLFEPLLDDAIASGLAAGRLTFSDDAAQAVRSSPVVWITFDTPVDQEDRPDVRFVESQVRALFPHISDGTVVLISSQIPVGTTRALARAFEEARPKVRVCFAYSPENLRLGDALNSFRDPSRVVVGTDNMEKSSVIENIFRPFGGKVVWMGIESAEMSKHALNAFLAVSISYINEIARLCEVTGADVKDVEVALRSEPRIGKRAYLTPGMGFSGGTLGRDLTALVDVGKEASVSTPLLAGARASNEMQRAWIEGTIAKTLGDVAGRRIAILGLTYKPGTDTLRRSAAVELCKTLLSRGARVSAYDPAVKALPPDVAGVDLCATIASALTGAEAVVIATEWPEFGDLVPEALEVMATRRVYDPRAALSRRIRDTEGVRYFTVGVA